MEIKYYAFALFITGLLCLVAILCRVLFADLRRQHKLLDEKESKLLELYRTIENIVDEFNEQYKAALDEIAESENRAAKRLSSMIPPPAPPQVREAPEEKKPRQDAHDNGRMRVASEVLERAERIVKRNSLVQPAVPSAERGGAVFQRLFDETVNEALEPAQDEAPKATRTKTILALAGNGKTKPQIAKELGITQNEVELVLGLTARK